MYATNSNQYYYNDVNMYSNNDMFVDTCCTNEPEVNFDEYSSMVLAYLGTDAYNELVANHARTQNQQIIEELQDAADYYATYITPRDLYEDYYAINKDVLQNPQQGYTDGGFEFNPTTGYQAQSETQVNFTPANPDKTPCPLYDFASNSSFTHVTDGQVIFDNSTTHSQGLDNQQEEVISDTELSMNLALPTELSVGKDGNMSEIEQDTSTTETEETVETTTVNSVIANPELPNLTHEEAQHSINIAVASTMLLFHLQNNGISNDRLNYHRKLIEQILDGDLHTAAYFSQWLQEFDRQAQGLTNNPEAIKRCFHTTLMQQILEQNDLNHKQYLPFDPILDNPLEFLKEVEKACYAANYGIALLEEVLNSLKTNKQREAVRKISTIATKLTDFNYASESFLNEIASICNDTQTVLTKSVSNSLSLGGLKARLLTSKMQEAQERPFTFGLPAFDKVLSNGWRAGELMVIGAAPGIGKTALALNLVMSRAIELRKSGKDKKILFFSLELTDLHVMDRLLKIQLNQLALESGKSKEDWNNFIQVVNARGNSELALCERLSEQLENNSSIYIVSNLKTIEEISHFVASTKARGVDVDFIVLDYLQNCRSSNPRYEVDKLGLINHVSHSLTEIAKRNNTRVCALGLLRDGKFDNKNPPTGADLKESRQIEADADIIITLTKEIGGSFGNLQDCLTCIQHNVDNGQVYANALEYMLRYSESNTGYAYTIPSILPRLDVMHVYIAKYRNGNACASSRIGFIGSLLSVCELAANASMYQHKAQPVSSYTKNSKNANQKKNLQNKTNSNPTQQRQDQGQGDNESLAPNCARCKNIEEVKRWWKNE